MLRGIHYNRYMFQEVCEDRRRCNDKLTIQEVLTILKHPGIIGNNHLAKEIESVLRELGHTVRSLIFSFRHLNVYISKSGWGSVFYNNNNNSERE